MLENLRTGFANWISPTSKAPALSTDSSVESVIASSISGASTPRRGTVQLIRAYRDLPWLRAVTHKIAEAIAATTWSCYYINSSNGSARKIKKLQRAKTYHIRQRMIKSLSDDITEVYDHPFLDMIEFGNPFLDGYSCIQMAQTYLDLKGESFFLINKNNVGMPISFWPIPPHWVSEVPSDGKNYFRITAQGVQRNVPADQVLWIKDPDPYNPYGRGSGVAESLADELDTDEYAAQFIKSFFYNAGMPSAIVSIPNADASQIERVAQVWNDQHRGAKKGHRTKFINYDAKVNTLSATYNDQQIVELRRYERDIIHQVFGIPPEILGIIQNSNRATVDAANSIFAEWVLIPRLERLRMAFQRTLVPFFDGRLIVDYENPTPDDNEFKLKVMQANKSSFERAEIRALAGYESHGAVDEVYLMTMNEYERPVKDSVKPVDPTPEEPEPEPEPEEPAPLETEARSKVLKVPAVTMSEIDQVMVALELAPDPLIGEIGAEWAVQIETWGEKEMLLIAEGTGQALPAFNMVNPKITKHLNDLNTARIKGLIDVTTKDSVRQTLIGGVQEGLGSSDIAENLLLVFEDAGLRRARAIARTEVVRSSNFATYQAQKQSGLITRRKWITMIDDRERDSHRDLNGTPASIDEPFKIGEYEAFHPGDFNVAEEDINCRCTTVAIIPTIEELEGRSNDIEIAKASRAQLALQYFKATQKWESKARKLFRERFKGQEKIVMQVFRRVAT